MRIRCRDFEKCSLEKESLIITPRWPHCSYWVPVGTCHGEPWGIPCCHFGIWPVQECSDFEILLFNYDFYLQHKNLFLYLCSFC